MQNLFATLLNYLTQESTWTGLTALLTAVGITLSPDMATQIGAVGLSIFGLIKVIVNERGAKEDAK